MAIRYASPRLERAVDDDPLLKKTVEKLVAGQVGAVFVRTAEGLDPFQDRITRDNVRGFSLHREAATEAADKLARVGFEIIHLGSFALIVRAPIADFETWFGLEVTVTSRTDRDPPESEDLVIASFGEGPLEGVRQIDGIAGVVLQQPATLFQAAPPIADDQLDDRRLRAALNVPAAPPAGDVLIGIVDTGFAQAHPAFADRNLICNFVEPLGGVRGSVDAAGHGTAMLALASAVAPHARFILAPTDPNEYAALERILERRPHVLSCSWGWEERLAPRYPHVRCAIYEAINAGTVVVMAAGNGAARSWPACLQEVIAVGGAHVIGDERQPSDLTSSFSSTSEPGRLVPDVCGLGGLSPRPYIQVPVPPGSPFDIRSAAASGLLEGDGTDPDDGWAFTSFSSGATAQVAGVAALVRAANRALLPNAVKEILLETAIAVPLPRRVAPPLVSPTGRGLVDAGAAIRAADAARPPT